MYSYFYRTHHIPLLKEIENKEKALYFHALRNLYKHDMQ